ncbi:MAG TPA: hypothetical protein VG712_07970 [Gemmatimonadales bacterium]|nr:hypothetical protein [Gemmatimonadales bacterium]
MLKTLRWGVLALSLSACSWQGTPVPVGGDLEALRGEWEGRYSSDQSGRGGAISFRLDAATDSAFGDVWMESAASQEIQGRDAPRAGTPRPHTAESLRIAFVRCVGGRVSGRLEVYRDPATGDRLFTLFAGELKGDEFRGTYETRREGSGQVITGEWQVARVRAP